MGISHPFPAQATEVLAATRVLVHAHGAVDEAHARRLAETVTARLPPSPPGTPWPDPPRYRKLPHQEAGGAVVVARPSPNAADDANCALVRTLDVGARRDLRTHARTSLLVHVLKEPFFTQLRTREQLGYLVSARYTTAKGRLHVVFSVVSKTADPHALRARFDAFLDAWDPDSVDLPKAKAALATKWTEPDDSMYHEALRFWAEIEHPTDDGTPDFDRAEHIAAQIRDIDAPELKRFYEDTVKRAPRAFEAMVFGKDRQLPAAGDPDLSHAGFHAAPPKPALVGA